MITRSHLTRDQLLGLLISEPGVDAQTVRRHLLDCAGCRDRMADLNKLAGFLKQVNDESVEAVAPEHLSDAQVSEYVFGAMDPAERDSVDAHLKSCGACMKHVMRLRSHRAANELARAAAVSEESKPNATVTGIGAIAQARKQRPMTMAWSGLVAAGVGALAVYVGGWMAGNDTPHIDPLSNNEHVAEVTPPPIDYGMLKARWLTAPVSQNGVDWYGGFIEATATGTVDMSKMTNRVQAEMVAETTARHLAYAELAEIIGGVRVSGGTSYSELLLKTSDLKVETDGFVRDARVIAKKVEWAGNVPKATVTLRVPLAGKKGLGALAGKYLRPADAPRSDLQALGSTAASRIVIDARGVGYEPALKVALTAGPAGEIAIDDVMYLPAAEYSSLADSAAALRARAAAGAGTLLLSEQDIDALRRGSNAAVSVVF